MTDEPNAIRPGEVWIDLDGWKLKLVPSLNAATMLSRRYKGIAPLVQALGSYDLDAFIAVIAAGAGLTEKGMKKLPEAVFQKGVIDLVGPLIGFVTTLSNGGRPVKPADEEDGEGEPDPSVD